MNTRWAARTMLGIQVTVDSPSRNGPSIYADNEDGEGDHTAGLFGKTESLAAHVLSLEPDQEASGANEYQHAHRSNSYYVRDTCNENPSSQCHEKGIYANSLKREIVVKMQVEGRCFFVIHCWCIGWTIEPAPHLSKQRHTSYTCTLFTTK